MHIAIELKSVGLQPHIGTSTESTSKCIKCVRFTILHAISISVDEQSMMFDDGGNVLGVKYGDQESECSPVKCFTGKVLIWSDQPSLTAHDQ